MTVTPAMLLKARLALGLTQRQVAAVVGCDAKYLGRVERGQVLPSRVFLHGVFVQLAYYAQRVAA